MDAKQTELKNEIMTLESTYNQLSIDIPKKQEFLNGIEEGKIKVKVIENILPELTQELVIYTLDHIEKSIGIKLPSASLGAQETLFLLYPIVDGQTTEEETYNPEQEIALKVETQTNTTLSYSQLKDLMAYLYDNELGSENKNRIVLNNLQLTSDPATGTITSSFSLAFYGLEYIFSENDTRLPSKFELGIFDIGKESVFVPFSEYGINYAIDQTEKTQQEETSDFFIMLSPITADQTTITLGQTIGMNSSSFLYVDKNDFVDVKIEVNKENGKYYYKLQAGNSMYPKSGDEAIAFDPGKNLDLLVMSSTRYGAEDKSGANVTIINNTDLQFNIRYSGEDASSPRFKIVKSSGSVIY